MPQITLSVPLEKLPILQEFLQVLGIERKNISSIFSKQKNEAALSSVDSNSPFSWENHCSELEFE